jgi:mRNA-degrading endonuclease RelE of RelBE toxin-antitoxin system
LARLHFIELTATAVDSLRRVADRKVLREVGKAIDGLARGPEAQGKPLEVPLDGVWSIHAARDRYRVLYEIDARKRRVTILLVGARRPGKASDVYRIAARILRDLTSRERRPGGS